MQPNDRAKFGATLNAVAEYYKHDLSPVVIGFWWNGTKHYTIEQFEYAIQAHIQNPESGQYMPKISDVVRIIDGRAHDRGQNAWAMVIGAVRGVGPYRSVVFDDPRIHAVIHEMGGWPKLCSHEASDMVFRQREFCDRYETLCSRPGNELSFPGFLSGEFDTHNHAHGHLEHVKTPAMIGDKDRCANVLAAGGAQQGQGELSAIKRVALTLVKSQ